MRSIISFDQNGWTFSRNLNGWKYSRDLIELLGIHYQVKMYILSNSIVVIPINSAVDLE